MAESINSTLSLPVATSRDVLTDILRDGAQRLLAQAIEAEVAEWIDSHARPARTRTAIVRWFAMAICRNARLPRASARSRSSSHACSIDERPSEAEPFSSKILPPYLRKTKSLEELIPWLYLKGVSTGDFNEALTALVGPNCPGLSASTVTRLKACWEDEFQEWNQRSLEGKQYVYLWADGVHFNIRLEEDRQCILVLMGATADGHKELIAVVDGFRESEQSWKALLLDVKSRGLVVDPKLATGDGALGFWKALAAGLSPDPRATLLGPQDGQRARQAAQAIAARGQGEAARHLDGRDESRCRAGVRLVRGHLRGQVPQGDRVLGEGPRRAA